MPESPGEVLASMGNYVFSADVLIDAVTRDAADESSAHDLGGNIIPALVERGQACVWDFANSTDPRRERARPRLLARRRDARRVLRRAHGPDLGRPDVQPLQRGLADPDLAGAAAAGEVRLRGGRAGSGRRWTRWSAPGVVVSGGTVRRSILSPGVHVHSHALVEGSVLMHDVDVGRGAIVRNAIVDKNVRIAPGAHGRRRSRGRPGALPDVGERDRRDREGRHRRGMRKVALLTREYPPDVYGGAGVHVEYLARELARAADVTVHCWGDERPPAAAARASSAYRPWDGARRRRPYAAALAGALDRPRDGGRRRRRRARPQPHVVREPRRSPREARARHPARRDRAQPRADAAVEARAARRRLCRSRASPSGRRSRRPTRSSPSRRRTSREILACYPAIDPARTSVIYNGIDADEYRPDPGTDVLERHGIDPARPVGRLRRPDHAPEGARPPARRRARDRPRGAARALRRCAGHARDRGARSRPSSSAVRAGRAAT